MVASVALSFDVLNIRSYHIRPIAVPFLLLYTYSFLQICIGNGKNGSIDISSFHKKVRHWNTRPTGCRFVVLCICVVVLLL